ncbi:mediator of RNA polymerase II transcription subunit 15-like, partial [Teleopsis dalmanni]|uniref:mediator of RNA polymerase II transcription subunit 15-like n=1 Tax=Teleopsis dalmanni TaxID=139649 RepID=UPI0018CD258C
MPLLLDGQGLVWFRYNKKDWNHWEAFKRDFLKFFLPHQYFERLEDELRNRLQKPGETFKMYLLELQKLMRHAGLNQESQLERVYRNMSTEYQIYIKRRNFTCLKELIALTEDFEELREEQNEVSRARDSEVIFGRVAVECARPLIIQKTMRRIANTPKCDKVIHSPVSKSPFRNQQQHQPITKQTPTGTSKIITSTTPASIPTQSMRHRNDAEQHHVSPQDRRLIPENPKISKQQQVPQEQESLPVQLKQMQQVQDPSSIRLQILEVQPEQSPKVKEMSAEYCQPRVIQKQEILQVEMKQAAQHQDLKHIKKQIPEIPRQPNPKFNEMPAEFGQQQDKHEHMAQQQDSRPSNIEEVQRHRSSSPINVTPRPDGKQLLDTPEHAVQEVFNISQEQAPSKTSLIPWKQKDKIIKTNSTKGQIYDEILSLTQSLPLTQLPQQKEKTIR